jgi:hypothetical protein
MALDFPIGFYFEYSIDCHLKCLKLSMSTLVKLYTFYLFGASELSDALGAHRLFLRHNPTNPRFSTRILETFPMNILLTQQFI